MITETLKGLARNEARYMWISLRYDTSSRISFLLVATCTCNTSGDVPDPKSSNEEEALVKATFCLDASIEVSRTVSLTISSIWQLDRRVLMHLVLCGTRHRRISYAISLCVYTLRNAYMSLRPVFTLKHLYLDALSSSVYLTDDLNFNLWRNVPESPFWPPYA
ncbi:uncharacterized protein ARMOST_17448 [Armillaria ostoyae]|uniref:Uncharacterized protein n=1 Tax=Armillaria ostoyae TaxID=47428 RepID=A0A284RZ67_ARMOS|nr:uncharacterized protein ARMOST_17448 [Armillaria ostoyae]